MESLFVYGTLGPGRPNAHVMENIGGTWAEGHVGGTLVNEGWGAGMGYPGLVPDNSGNRVPGFVFSSENFARHWQALDAFEGEGYQRVPVDVTTTDGTLIKAWVYSIKR